MLSMKSAHDCHEDKATSNPKRSHAQTIPLFPAAAGGIASRVAKRVSFAPDPCYPPTTTSPSRKEMFRAALVSVIAAMVADVLYPPSSGWLNGLLFGILASLGMMVIGAKQKS
jgi:hypothetical protein